jgi:hypothetical protein
VISELKYSMPVKSLMFLLSISKDVTLLMLFVKTYSSIDPLSYPKSINAYSKFALRIAVVCPTEKLLKTQIKREVNNFFINYKIIKKPSSAGWLFNIVL